MDIRYKKKRLVLVMIFVLVNMSMLISCGKSFKFPNEKDFSLNLSVNKTELKVGDELIVNAIFKNLNNFNYHVDSTASFSKSGLIHINLLPVGEEDKIFVGSIRYVDLEANQEIKDEASYKPNKPGKYKVVVSSIFYMKDPNNKDREQKYVIKADDIIVEFK
jgi:hypothetical protein